MPVLSEADDTQDANGTVSNNGVLEKCRVPYN